jgi:hypothetical protein
MVFMKSYLTLINFPDIQFQSDLLKDKKCYQTNLILQPCYGYN